MVLQSSQRIIWALFRSGAGCAVVQYPTPLSILARKQLEFNRSRPLNYIFQIDDHILLRNLYTVHPLSEYGFLVLVFEEIH